MQPHERPLLDSWPGLKSLPVAPLCDLPTPVRPMEALGHKLGIGSLHVKRDDRSAVPYGGNKSRKLEFLLADARQRNKKEVLTFGYAGSNFALATSIYARQLGMRCISMLLPQANARYVRQNLLLGDAQHAELHTAPNTFLLGIKTLWQSLRHLIVHGRWPYWIPAGGSSPLGVLGFVNAAYELKAQIDQGNLPAPDVVYLPLGSMGSAAGLDIGMRAAGLKCRIVAVRVVPTRFGSEQALKRMIEQTISYIRKLEPGFPNLSHENTLCEVRHDFFGQAYGQFTAAGREAASLAGDLEGLKLDGTYSAKAMASLVSDARSGMLRDKNVLFWNTSNSRDIETLVDGLDYRLLPAAFHRYFNQKGQD